MNFINQNDLHKILLDKKSTKDWLKRAFEAQKAVAQSQPKKRSEEIERNQKLWKELKVRLCEISNGKCWYCEAKEKRSDLAVDHFRPKNAVRENTAHEGYWWLAFDWKNYRLSCTYCNSLRTGITGTRGGKSDYFPLVDETKRAKGPKSLLSHEKPLLLDPTKASDVPVIWYDQTGEATATKKADKLAKTRADISIKRYHLNEEACVEARRTLISRILRLVEAAEKSRMPDTVFDLIITELADLIRGQSEFSRVAKCTLKGLRGNKNCIPDIVLEL